MCFGMFFFFLDNIISHIQEMSYFIESKCIIIFRSFLVSSRIWDPPRLHSIQDIASYRTLVLPTWYP